MKKFLLLVTFLALATLAYAYPKWVPTAYSGDQLVVSGPATMVDANIYWTGVTVGDKLQLKNGTTSSGTTFYTFIAPTANGSYRIPQVRKDFIVDTGIYMDETKTGGTIGIELKYQ